MNTPAKFLSCSIALVSLGLFQTAFAGAQKVMVNNGANNPVPVNVQGQVPVNVQNEVVVRNANEPSQQPYDIAKTAVIADLENTATADFDVPAGKRLVIESVTVSAFLPTGQKLVFAGFDTKTVADPSVNHSLNIVAHGGDAQGHDVFNASQLTRGYSEAGTASVRVTVQRSSNLGNDDFAFISVTGYLVDIPAN